MVFRRNQVDSGGFQAVSGGFQADLGGFRRFKAVLGAPSTLGTQRVKKSETEWNSRSEVEAIVTKTIERTDAKGKRSAMMIFARSALYVRRLVTIRCSVYSFVRSSVRPDFWRLLRGGYEGWTHASQQ